MAQYPRTQAQISALAESMIGGFSQHPDYYPHSDCPALQQALADYNAASNDLVSAQSQVAIAAEIKRQKLDSLQEVMKNQLKLSQVDCTSDPVKLECIGWSPRREPQSIEAPSQPLNLRIAAQSDCCLFLEWDKPPYDVTRPVRYYKLERRKVEQTTEDWQMIATSINNELKLTDQPQMIRFEYRVKSINASGESLPSNVIAVVL